ncbi:MAG TPA: tripartite tricarboxylate transporter substrate-binding protein [Beijerinckiaceae bacterium]|jgi:tripartite-type tricarboxylate transporter receptor subunit TctC
MTIALTRLLASASLVAGAALATAAPAAAQSYPERNVRFLVAFAPGGPADIVARVVGQALTERWGKSVIVENRGGAGGNIAAAAATRAEPDGYTILVTTSALAVNLSFYDNPGYALSDFKVAALVATAPNIIVGAPNLKADTLREVIALAKTENLSFGSAGAGTTPHLSGERVFRLLGKVDVRHVPFTGAGPAVGATLSGHVPLASVALSAAIEQVKAGAVKGLGVTSAQRLPELPNVPTVTETGLGEVEDATWVALFAPAKTPDDVLRKINADAAAAIADPKAKEALSKAGFLPLSGDLAKAQAYVEAEARKWAEVVGAVGAKAAP